MENYRVSKNNNPPKTSLSKPPKESGVDDVDGVELDSHKWSHLYKLLEERDRVNALCIRGRGKN